MKRNFLGWLPAVFLLAIISPAPAQQPIKIPRIGFVTVSGSPNRPGFYVDAFRQGLRDLGYIEGKNILVEYRYAAEKPDRVPGFVAELVQLNVDVLVSSSSEATRTAKQATKTISIVMLTSQDPVAAGLVDSLAHPGGNITGLTRLSRELSGKRLELFKEALPAITRVGVLGVQGNSGFKGYEIAAHALKIPLQLLEVRSPNPDLEGAFQDAANGRVSALIVVGSSLINGYQKRITELAIKKRLPLMCEAANGWVGAGGLMSYSSNDAENFRRAAYYVDRILKGAKPADLPVEQPTKFEFVINLKTAKQIGVTIPPNVLARADRVIR